MALLDPADRRERGAAIAAEVQGAPAAEAEVQGAPAAEPASLVEESWRDFVYAEVWSRPGLDRRARFLVALSGAAIAGDGDACAHYANGALHAQALTLAELREAALHLAVYGGWSAGGVLDRAVSRAAARLDLPPADVAPIRAEPWDAQVRLTEGAAEFAQVMTFSGGPPVTPYLEAIANFVFGEMWCRPGLDQRARRWITLVGVCASGADTPIKSHVHAAMASGNCTPDEMQEFVPAFGIHAGWPRASVIQGEVIAMSRKVEAGLPWNG
jgi:4-carboxymuconolactone decarboxylase